MSESEDAQIRGVQGRSCSRLPRAIGNKGKHRPIDSDEYQKHHVFSELDKYIDFYESLSWSVSSFGTTGTNAVINIDTYIFSSIKGTLESIQQILKNGRINDAYALLRKYHDSAIINIYSNLYLDDHVSIEHFIVDKVNNWLKGEDKLPEYRVMSSYIRNSEKVSVINDLLYSDKRYKNIRDRCNDNTHYNFFFNMLLNDHEMYNDTVLKCSIHFPLILKIFLFFI